jgi:uncharacterized protein DUF2510
MTAAPQWARDPTGRHDMRYWNGDAWTENVSDRGIPGRDPLPDLAIVRRSQLDDAYAGLATPPGVPRVTPARHPGPRLSPAAHVALTVLSAGLWLVALPGVLMWRRGARLAASLWALAALLAVAAGAADAAGALPGLR